MTKNTTSRVKKNQTPEKQLVNGLGDLVSSLGFSRNLGTQLSQTATIMLNNRYYMLSNDRTTLSYMYSTHGLVQTMIDQPVEDGFRGGLEIKSSELGTEDIQKLQNYIKENKVIKEVERLAKWTRLYGGGGMVINSVGNPKEPLNPNAISKDTPLEFYAADLWELNSTNPNIYSEEKPYIKYGYDSQKYNFYGFDLHHTRVLKTKGKDAPSYLRPMLRGWGMSEIERLVRSINQYLKNNDLIFELLDEAKVDVWKIKGFNSSLINSQGTQKTEERIQLANQVKNFQHALVMDADDDYSQKQLTFSGIADILNEIRKGIAADMKMPLTKIFGISASGFNSGEDDLENYNSMIESSIREEFDYVIIQMLKLICKKLFDYIPEDLQIEYKSLRILTAEQEELVKNHKMQRLLALYDKGIIDSSKVIEVSNLDNLVGIELDDTGIEDFPEPPEGPDSLTLKDEEYKDNSKIKWFRNFVRN